VASLDETLTLHGLGLFPLLGVSLKITNCLESLNAQLGQLINKVDHWRTSDQKQRWVARALSLIKPRLRRIKATAISRSCARHYRPRSGRSSVWKELVLRDDRIEAASEF
jgi:hypothetical protein